MQSVNNGERLFHLLSSRWIAFFPTVGNTTWNMLRHASIYRVPRNCKINQRSSVCQQRDHRNKTYVSLQKKNLSFHSYKRLKTNFLIRHGDVPNPRQPGESFGVKKALVSPELLENCWDRGTALMLEEKEGGKRQWRPIFTEGRVYFPHLSSTPRGISQCMRDPFAGKSSGKDAALIPTSYSKAKATCACP